MAVKSVNAICQLIREHGQRRDNPNEHGNVVHRHHADSERYAIDFSDSFQPEGWLQFDTDQDAAYFGVWVHPGSRVILTYAEGDWTVCDCPTIENYHAEIRHMIEFYGEGFIARAIDTDGTQTTYRQDRGQFLLLPAIDTAQQARD